MNKKILYAIIIAAVLLTVPFSTVKARATYGEGKSDWELVEKLTKNAPVLLIDSNKTDEETVDSFVLSRNGKPYVVVEKIISKSFGGSHGTYRTPDRNSYIIGYNKNVPKGTKVVSYIIWSGESNECDDVYAVVDNGSYRK